jgi:hypothetical protein
MDLTIKYTEEEQKRFDEVFKLKEEVRNLEKEQFLLGREMKEHTMENHVETVSPVVYLLIGTGFTVLFCADIIVGKSLNIAAAIAFAACTPIVALIFIVLFFIKLRKYIYQTSKDPKVWAKAKQAGFNNYYAEEKRIHEEYEKTRKDLEKLREIYKAKQDDLDLFVEMKSKENYAKQKEIVEHSKQADALRKNEEEAAAAKSAGEKEPIKIEVQEPLARYEKERDKRKKEQST